MSESEYIKLFSGNLIDTEHLAQTLKAADITPIVKHFPGNSGVAAYLVTDYEDLKEVYVHESEFKKASEILESTFPKSN